MPLPTFRTADEIPEAFRAEYEERDGVWAPRELHGLKSSVAKEREAREAAEARIAAADRRAKELEAQISELAAQAKAKKSGISDEVLAEIRADFEKKLTPEKEARERAEAELRRLRLDAAVKGELAKAGVRGERLDVFWKLVADRFDLTTEGNPIVTVDKGAKLPEYVSDTLKREFPEFYAAPPASGGGANPSATLPKGADFVKMLATNPLALLEQANAAGAKR